MTEEQWNVIRQLTREGYAVITWTPEELNGVSACRVEDRLVELGHEIIEDLS